MKKWLYSNHTNEVYSSMGILILRIATGLAMASTHGWSKFQNYESMVKEFSAPPFFLINWMSPNVALASTIFAELACGVLMAIGLFTRIAAGFMGFTMAIAFFIVHGKDAFAVKELAFLYLIICVVILITGPGKYSLDAKLGVQKRRMFT